MAALRTKLGRTAAIAILGIAAFVSGCGVFGGGHARSTTLAAVVTDHAGTPISSKSIDYQEFDDDVSTQLRYPDHETVQLSVGTRPRHGFPTCTHPPAYAEGCAVVDGAVLLWQTEEPEEDPGIIHLYQRKGGKVVMLTYVGPKITGDPRQMELAIDVDTLVDIVQDPRVR